MPGLYEATFTAQELSLLMAGARMALGLMEAHPEEGRPEGEQALRRVLDDFDRAVQRLHRGEPSRQA